MLTLGDKVASLRASRNWTLQQLSDLTGISVSHLNAIEHGTRPNPSFNNVIRIAEAFEVPVAHFVHANCKPVVASATNERIAEARATFAQQSDFAHFDSETREFLRDKQSTPYVVFAKRLAEHASQDPLDLLDMLTEFLKSQRHPSY